MAGESRTPFVNTIKRLRIGQNRMTPASLAVWSKSGTRLWFPIHSWVAGEIHPVISRISLCSSSKLLEKIGSWAIRFRNFSNLSKGSWAWLRLRLLQYGKD